MKGTFPVVFAVASLALAGCVAEPGDPSSDVQETAAPLTAVELGANPATETYASTVRPYSSEQTGTSVVHAGTHAPIVPTAGFQTVVSHDDTKP